MISISDLKFSYSTKTNCILDIPEFELNSQETFFLFGPSGSGKTTFLEILAGILSPQSGKVVVDGVDLASLAPAQKDRFRAEHLGIIFQQFNLIPYLTMIDNIDLPFLFNGKPKDENLRSHLIQKLGLENIKDQVVSKLSTGQQQRVAVARALSSRPKLIIADEPTSALDYDHREKFLSLLFELCHAQKTTLVFVSHDRSIEKLFSKSLSLLEINRAAIKGADGEV
jgi:putative ABC transport system ATP-binding protein